MGPFLPPVKPVIQPPSPGGYTAVKTAETDKYLLQFTESKFTIRL